MSALIPLGQDEFESKVIHASQPALVEFGAPWCGPCRLLDPVLEEMAVVYGDSVDFFSVDVDDSPQLAMDYQVLGVPTVILFKDGRAMERMTGYRPRKALEQLFFSNLQ
jgi:thioredoxin